MKPKISVTTKKIAEYANVSRGTVDRALHGREGIRPDVRKRILEIAENLGYRPNSVAKALSNYKRKLTIGLLLPSVNNPFFADLIEGARDAQRDMADYGVELTLTQMRGYDIDEQISRIDGLVDAGIDMLALTPFDDVRIARKINWVVKGGIKVFTVNSDIENSLRTGFIGVDFVQGGKLAAGLIGLINRRANVLIINGSPKLLSHSRRVQGFMETMGAHFPEIRMIAEVPCNDSHFEAYDIVREQLRVHPQIDVVYIVGEGIIGVCAALAEFHDHHVDVVCFDDVPHTRELFQQGKISATICQQPHRQGYSVIQQCYNCFAGIAGPSQTILVENIIKIRESF